MIPFKFRLNVLHISLLFLIKERFFFWFHGTAAHRRRSNAEDRENSAQRKNFFALESLE